MDTEDLMLNDSEILRMKRKYEKDVGLKSTSFRSLRHNLLPDFEFSESEDGARSAKSAKRRDGSSFQSTSGRSLLSPHTFNESPSQNRQLALKDSEIMSLKATITKLENRISGLERGANQAAIEHDNNVTELKRAKDRETKLSVELKSKLQYVMEREKNAREEVLRLEKELQQQNIEMDSKVLQERRARMDSSDKLTQDKKEMMQKAEELQNKVISQSFQLEELQIRYEECLAQLALRKRTTSSCQESSRSVEELEEALRKETKRVEDLERELAEHKDNIVTTRALKADLDMVPSMKSELEKLREDNAQLLLNEQNTLLLEEEIRGLKIKVAQVDSLQSKAIELELENEELKGRLSRWEASDTSGTRRPQSPTSFARRVNELEGTNAELLIQQGELQTRVNLCDRKLEQAQTENNKLSAALSMEKSTTTQLNDLIKRLKRKMLLQSKEKAAYKGLLDSYESEVTISVDAEKGSQIEKLEEVIHDYKTFTAEAESKIESLSNQLSEAHASLYQAQQQLYQQGGYTSQQSSQADKEMITQLREQLATTENELIEAQQQRDFLDAKIEQRHLQGDYDPSKTKIIHMLANPHAMAQQARQEELGTLREDNERLKKRNKILEETGGKVQDITMQVEEKLGHSSPSKEVEELKSQLASADMRVQRLKEVFTKTSKEFREVVYQLTGYRFDIPTANQYRLISMYAERKKDHLLFQQNAEGEIQMLQTDFSMSFRETMEHDLQKCGSLPLFLSHITLDLFNRQTIALN